MNKVLVTGGTGFIGRELSKRLCEARYVLRKGHSVNHVDSYEIDSLDGETCWTGAFDGIDVVIHLAGLAHNKNYKDYQYEQVNVAGTLKLAKDASRQGIKRFVFVSSIGVYGQSNLSEPFNNSSIVDPINNYTKSKYKAECGLLKLAKETGLEVVIIRPTLVYGVGAPGNFGMLTQLVDKFSVLPFGLVNNRRDFIAVQNLADILITCTSHPNAAGHTFLASDSETVSIKEFTNAIGEGLGKKVLQLPIPVSLMRLVGKVTGKSAMIEQLYDDLQVDSSCLEEVLGWTAPFTMQQAMATLRKPSR
ncbi:NAD-dependent epimerase/dehydratase family protein [Vibrio splendidus]|uniref:NAD-dependent epimerase/dehydratase family protein n=1 Tax=Vibrio splendidus TaxID=29497 RepID=UPI0021B25BD9|nr:NAD-dependent epimerase/dehydratase family protein [Vibrio splendidus]UWZ97356.1 NAD-dependent epimerase/dehydratase family protein [Vibrio splendidus]